MRHAFERYGTSPDDEGLVRLLRPGRFNVLGGISRALKVHRLVKKFEALMPDHLLPGIDLELAPNRAPAHRFRHR